MGPAIGGLRLGLTPLVSHSSPPWQAGSGAGLCVLVFLFILYCKIIVCFIICLGVGGGGVSTTVQGLDSHMTPLPAVSV